jgi:hypothetical protein
LVGNSLFFKKWRKKFVKFENSRCYNPTVYFGAKNCTKQKSETENVEGRRKKDKMT